MSDMSWPGAPAATSNVISFKRTSDLLRPPSWMDGSAQDAKPSGQWEAPPRLGNDSRRRAAAHRLEGVGLPTPSIQERSDHRVGYSAAENKMITSLRGLLQLAEVRDVPESILQTYIRWGVTPETLHVALGTAAAYGSRSGQLLTHLIKRARAGDGEFRTGMPWGAHEEQAIRDALGGAQPVQVLAWAVYGGQRWDSLVSRLRRRENAVASRAERLMGWPSGYLCGFRDISGNRIGWLDDATLADLAILARN